MMVKITTRQLLLFSSIYLCLKLLDVRATGVFFEEDEAFGGRERGSSMAPLFNKVFHQCGIDEACNFVVRNNLSQKFTKVSNVEDLPLDKDNFKVWYKKKVKRVKSLKRERFGNTTIIFYKKLGFGTLSLGCRIMATILIARFHMAFLNFS